MSDYVKNVTKTIGRAFAPISLPLKSPKVTVVGTRRSGKSTVVNLLHKTLISLANEKQLRYRIHEYQNARTKTSRILGARQSVAEMMDGRFPEPTPKGTTFEADMEIIFPKTGLFGKEQHVQLPVIDLAGEEVARLIQEVSMGTYKIPEIVSFGNQLHERVLQADGFIPIVPASQITVDGQVIERVMDDTISQFPDVNLAHILETVYDYKNRCGGNPIRAICPIITQYDKVSGILGNKGINLKTEEGRHTFMSLYFPETYDMLHFIGMNKVKILPSWVETVVDPVTKEQINHHEPFWDGSFSPLIKIKQGQRLENGKMVQYIEPSHNRDTFLDLVDWLKENFPS